MQCNNNHNNNNTNNNGDDSNDNNNDDVFNWNENMRQSVYTGTETEWTGLIGKATPNGLVILGGRWNDQAVWNKWTGCAG